MHPVIANNKNEIAALCKKHRIQKLYAFGSVLGPLFNGQSDVDLLYEIDPLFKKDRDFDYATNLFEFEAALSALLKRKIDLIRYDFKVSVPFIRAVAEKKELVYAQ